MTEYIKRDDAKVLKDICTDTDEDKAYFLERLNEIPSADIGEILERSTIGGYTFEELAVFADACKKKGITEEDMVDFSLNVASVYEYVLEEVGRQFDAAVMNGWEKKHE